MKLSQPQHNSCLDTHWSGFLSMCLTVDPEFFMLFHGKTLLSAGAAVDTVDNDGETALMWAAENGHFHIVEVGNPDCSLFHRN